ncbi:unnamed protein product [Schistosoma margrebowiei]|uniref:Uncharacterized protein n=1 Tax=Schistosoma margrebowiei TaxID=48269 RepID=A0A183LBQ0_9TREM|nr:unnamed protein product [Schistosoma margrebowiei]
MADEPFVITDQERLDRLNNEAREKRNRDIPFTPDMSQPFYNFVGKIFGTEKPYEAGYCVARVGLQNTDKHCKIYWEDLLECQNHNKAVSCFFTYSNSSS